MKAATLSGDVSLFIRYRTVNQTLERRRSYRLYVVIRKDLCACLQENVH
jgi:hypothetical protein